MKYIKTGNDEIKTIETVTDVKEVVYKYDFLVAQKAQIEKNIAESQIELDRVIKLLGEADKLGVVSTSTKSGEALE